MRKLMQGMKQEITSDRNNKGVEIKAEVQVGKLHQRKMEIWLSCERKWPLRCGMTM